MKVGVIQSCYVPWRGYFDFIRSVDLFVVYDDVQYSKGSWRNRNQVKTADGLRWLTVPVAVSLGQRIDEVRIAQRSKSWIEEHGRLLRASLEAAPYFQDAWQLWSAAVGHGDELLSVLNVRLLRSVCAYLGIRTPLVMSSEYPTLGSSTTRLLSLLQAVGASSYLSGPSAADYLDLRQFAERGIGVQYKSYDYPPYPQLHGEFVSAVTILDLIANCGPGAAARLASSSADRSVTP
ncbi:MAG TPA: WbqC family protein [Steroidobacteraceae bacterium]|nr:WbqC family protein [Steroidobacteraceae bacterium]